MHQRSVPLPALGLIAATATVGLLLSGSGSPRTGEPAEAPYPPARVDYDGCMTVIGRPGDIDFTCIYEVGAPIRVWIDHPDGLSASLTVDQEPVAAEPYIVPGETGYGFRVTVDTPGAQTLTVHVPEASPWSLSLRDDDEVDAELRETRDDLRSRGLRLQRALFKRATPQNVDAVIALVEEALEHELIGDAAELVAGSSYVANVFGDDPEAATRILASVGDAEDLHPLGRAAISIYRGHTLRQTKDRAQAVIIVRDGSRLARRLKNVGLQRDGLSEYSLLLAELGYTDAARYWSAQALKLRPHTGQQLVQIVEVLAATNRTLMRGGQPHEDPRGYYEQLLFLTRHGSSTLNQRHASIAQLALAELDLRDLRPRYALARLDDVQLPLLAIRQQAIARELDLRIHLELESDRETLRTKLDSLERVAARSLDLDAQWNATVLRGQVFEALGDLRRAEQAYADSEDLLDSLLLLTPIGVGGDVMNTRYEEGTRNLTALLLRRSSPRPADAMCVMRRAHARISRLPGLRLEFDEADRESQLAQRYRDAKQAYEELLRKAEGLPVDELERVQREAERQKEDLQRLAHKVLATRERSEPRAQCEDLRPPSPDELLLGLYPLGDDLLVLATDRTGSTHARLRGALVDDRVRVSPEQRAALLSDLDARVEAAARIRVLASGGATQLAPHAFDWRGSPLGLQRPVVYSLELPWTTATEPPSSARPRAVVHHDVKADGSAEVADHAALALAELGYDIERSNTAEGVSTNELQDRLTGASHFLYAGHAYFISTQSDRKPLSTQWPPYPGGSASTPAYLPPNRVGRLEVTDILMAGPTPRVVVLMGCATGVNDLRTIYGGPSLATAFLSAGTRVAIASTRIVKSKEAFALNRALYDHLSVLDLDEPGRWMTEALRAARADGLDEASIADYRVYVP